MVSKGVDIFLNILQAIRSKEIRFFSNSHLTMDLEELQNTIETKLEIKVELYLKAIFRGK